MICVDFDGVIADTGILKRRWIAAATGRETDNLACDRTTLMSFIGREAYAAMQSEIGFADTLSAPPVVGAVRGLKRLCTHTEIVVVSARPSEKMVWLNEWVCAHGLSEVITSVVTSHGGLKADVARRLGADWLIDDDQRHAFELSNETTFVHFGVAEESTGKPFFVAQDWIAVETLVRARL